jgi:hypothetical protein
MPSPRRFRILRPLSLAIVLLAAPAFGDVSGAPDASGRFHACVRKRNGKLRLVDDPTTCLTQGKKAEVPISWNQSGPQGLKGDAGTQGPPGPSAFIATAASDGDFQCPGSGWCYIPQSPGGPIIGLTSPPSSTVYQDRWSSTGLLFLDRTARVLAHASFAYTSPSGSTGKDANCYIRSVSESGSPAVLGNASTYLRIAGAESTSASLTAVGVLQAGTYDVQLFCYSYGTPALAIRAAGLTVTAVGY